MREARKIGRLGDRNVDRSHGSRPVSAQPAFLSPRGAPARGKSAGVARITGPFENQRSDVGDPIQPEGEEMFVMTGVNRIARSIPLPSVAALMVAKVT